MTSERKIAANRINARKSCGPRTAAGKGRVSRNALRHGLAAMKHVDPVRLRDIELMAKAMCADDTNPLLFEHALVLAESEMVLRCVRAEKVAAIERLRDVTAVPLAKDNRIALAKAKMRELDLAWAALEQIKVRFSAMTKDERTKLEEEYERQAAQPAPKPMLIKERDAFDAMREAVPDLDRLVRYERRAWSRRKRAFRNFMDIKFKSYER